MICTVRGDITKIENVDAIVNAANTSLLGGGGVDGAIHRAAGPKLLENCYRNCLQVAVDNGVRKIAFPSIFTGVYHFPVQMAAEIAVKTVKQFIKANPGKLDLVMWVLFDERTEKIYEQAVALCGSVTE